MLTAIRYCHSKGIVHRDLKLENFLFESDSDDSPLKLIGKFKPKKNANTFSLNYLREREREGEMLVV